MKQTEAFVRLEKALHDDPDLAQYDREIYPEIETILGGLPASSLLEDSPRAQLHLTMQIIQLMEDVFLALDFERYYAHSLNRGWMNLFRRWASTNTLRLLWPSLRSSFSKAFVEFAEYQLNLKPPPAPPVISDGALTVTARDRLVAEFKQEWPSESIQEEFSQMLRAATSIIFRAAPQQGATPQDHVWGVAMANPQSNPIKVIVWVRGGYRGIGIGKELLEKLMKNLRESSRYLPFDTEAMVELPKLREDFAGYTLEKDGWMRFYAREGFTRQSDDPNRPDRYVLKTRII